MREILVISMFLFSSWTLAVESKPSIKRKVATSTATQEKETDLPPPQSDGSDDNQGILDSHPSNIDSLDPSAEGLPPAINYENDSPTPKQPWFRSAGEYLSYRSSRVGLATEPVTRLHTDGSRFDVTLGKRIPLWTIGQKSLSEAFVLGVDGGIYSSLFRQKTGGALVFATETFDGFFGTFLGYTSQGNLALLRWGHLSAHLVDNAPLFRSPINYSHFWAELILGKSWPNPETPANWDIHIQGSVGLNYEASPPERNPRYRGGLSAGYSPWGADSLAFIGSGDMGAAGVDGQKKHFTAFGGVGFLGRPENTHRPFRIGVSHNWGSDPRNQYHRNTDKFTAVEVQLDL